MKKDCNPELKKPGYVCNPLTGRWIKADGATAKRLGLSVAKTVKAAAPKSPKKSLATAKPAEKGEILGSISNLPPEFQYEYLRNMILQMNNIMDIMSLCKADKRLNQLCKSDPEIKKHINSQKANMRTILFIPDEIVCDWKSVINFIDNMATRPDISPNILYKGLKDLHQDSYPYDNGLLITFGSQEDFDNFVTMLEEQMLHSQAELRKVGVSKALVPRDCRFTMKGYPLQLPAKFDSRQRIDLDRELEEKDEWERRERKRLEAAGLITRNR